MDKLSTLSVILQHVKITDHQTQPAQQIAFNNHMVINFEHLSLIDDTDKLNQLWNKKN